MESWNYVFLFLCCQAYDFVIMKYESDSVGIGALIHLFETETLKTKMSVTKVSRTVYKRVGRSHRYS
jgi:hypothetical protein